MEEVRCDGIPDAVTFLSALKACADIGAIENGKEIHKEIVTLGLLEGDVVLGNDPMDMYAKVLNIYKKHGKCLMNFLCGMWSPELH